MSEETVTNPIDQEVSGSDRPRRSNREVEQVFAEMFEGESQEEPRQGESEIEEMESSGEHEEVGQEEAEASANEYEDGSEESEEQPEGHSEFYRVIVDGTNTLQQLQRQMESTGRPNVDWNLLERTDPVQWLKLREMERQREGQLHEVRRENAQMQQLLEAQQAEELQQELDREQRLLLEKIPEWSNPSVRSDEQRRVVEFARSIGFTDQRGGQVTSGTKLREAKKMAKIKTANPGNRETIRRTSTRNQQALRANLKTSGKVDDAAALFATLMDG